MRFAFVLDLSRLSENDLAKRAGVGEKKKLSLSLFLSLFPPPAAAGAA
jgi:hypothetical protein